MAVTEAGGLFTFGTGLYGVLGHGNMNSSSVPMQVGYLSMDHQNPACCQGSKDVRILTKPFQDTATAAYTVF